jgi:hypothetical protein
MHTPGPWINHGLSITTQAPIPHHTIPRSPAPRYVAQAHWHDAPEWDGNYDADNMNMPSDYAQAQANARLMASAPDLLSALRWLADCVSEGLESAESMEHARPELVYGITQARAAIDRATRR